MLDQHLDRIYLSENLEKSFPMIKSKSKTIVAALHSGNLFKARSLLNSMPDVSLDELAIASAKKGSRFYNEAKRKVKGDSTELQKIYILIYSSLKGLQASTKNKSVFEKIEEALSALNDFAKKYSGHFIGKGFTVYMLMGLITFFFGQVPSIVAFFIAAGTWYGVILFWLGVLFLVFRIILNTYFSLKGIK